MLYTTPLLSHSITNIIYTFTLDTFTDFSKQTTTEINFDTKINGKKITSSLGYWAVKRDVQETTASSNGKTKAKTRIIVAIMRIERYYSGVREELSMITDDALTLLDRQDYIGFFKSCGPNYVRSIRRAQELTAIFKFTSTSAKEASEFSEVLQIRAPRTDNKLAIKKKFQYSSIMNSLEINILGYGLGLNVEGSSTLVATQLEEYDAVLKFAFKSFTQVEDANNIGMVYAIAVLPWVDNVAFQIASRVIDENVIIPLPRSMIPKARNIPGATITTFVNDDTTRQQFKCKNNMYNIDKYGYCCENTALYDPNTSRFSSEERNITVSVMVCRPVRTLDKSIVKNNMSNNGEFVTILDSVMRDKLNQMFTLEKCLTSLHSFSSKYDYHILARQDVTMYDDTLLTQVTLKEMKIVLDPLDNFYMLTQLGGELDEFVDMYYHPCIAALFGMNIGSSPDVEPQYFMAHGWLQLNACAQIPCLADNMRWNRQLGGCIPSLVMGSEAPAYGGTTGIDDVACTKSNKDMMGDTLNCKYDEVELKEKQDASNICWGDDTSTPNYFINNFCMPQITNKKANRDEKDLVNVLENRCVWNDNNPYI